MTQDTRKDRRVKIVSLNVRYKSATVDEFIENHAHDVSRGGIYIKTSTPFPSGTLLKFEIRLSSDQPLITGVGRVVWKRDGLSGDGGMPSGMGVKFIKVDDSSKTVIDKLVNTHSDAGKTYEAEIDASAHAAEPAHASPVAAARPQKTKTPAPMTAVRPGKATMVGIGSVPLPTPSHTSSPASSRSPAPVSTPPRPAHDPGMFPHASATPAPNEVTQEPTVMRQAAELLEEALREAGGSMAEIGTNPLYSGAPPGQDASPLPQDAPLEGKPPQTAADALTVHKLLSPLPDAPAAGDPIDEEAKARAMVAGMSPGVSGAKAKTTSDSPLAVQTPSESKSTARDSVRAASPSKAGTLTSPPAAAHSAQKKSGGGAKWLIMGVLGAAAAVVFGVPSVRDALFGEGATPSSTEQPAATTAPPALPTPTASATGEVPAVSVSAEIPAPSATQAAEAGAAPSAKPLTPAAAPIAPLRAPEAVTHAAPPPGVPQPKAPPAAAEPAPKPATPAAAPATPPKPPHAVAKPKAASDDNPY